MSNQKEFEEQILLASLGGPFGLDEVKQLLADGADATAKDENGNPALHVAARGDNAALISLLLTAGASVNAKDKDGWTALHHAASTGNTEIASTLLSAGADKAAVTNGGVAAFDIAQLKGHLMKFGLLLTV